MADLRIEIEGVGELVIDMKALINELSDMNVMNDLAREGARLASAFAPRDTGRLAASIRGSKSKNKAVVRAGNNRSIVYAGVQNWGWPARNITGTGFMQKADDALDPHGAIEAAIIRLIRQRGLQ